jgi:hypothetical protein
MPLEFVFPILQIDLATHMVDEQSLQNRLEDLMELEEDRLVVGFSQVVKK